MEQEGQGKALQILLFHVQLRFGSRPPFPYSRWSLLLAQATGADQWLETRNQVRDGRASACEFACCAVTAVMNDACSLSIRVMVVT